MTEFTDSAHSKQLDQREHNNDVSAKRIQVRGLDTDDGIPYNVTVHTPGTRVAFDVAVVDGSGNQVTSFGSTTQYADGAARGSATGTLAMGDDGTNIQSLHTDTSGDLQIDVLSSALPTGAATAALQTQPGVDIGDVTVNNASGASAVNIQDGGNSITVDGTVGVSGTVAVTQSGTWDEVGINDSGNSITVDAPVGTPAFVRLSDGASAISTLPVSLASVPSHAVTNAGTFAVQDSTTQTNTGNAATSLAIMDDWDNGASDGASVSGDVAHDAVDAGEPVKIGGKARTANPTAVAANDRVDAFFDDVGRQVTLNGVPRDLLVSPTIVTITSSTAETTALAAGGSGVFHDVYAVIITNTSATATEVTFKDATAGTDRFIVSAPANDTRGISLPFVVPQSSSNANWTATCADSVASIKISVLAMKNV